VGVASIRFAALAVNKTFPSFRSSTTIRCVLAGLSCLIWAQIVIGLLVAHISTTAFAVYPQLFVLDIYNLILAASETGVIARERLK
jgi:hypothetical protein